MYAFYHDFLILDVWTQYFKFLLTYMHVIHVGLLCPGTTYNSIYSF